MCFLLIMLMHRVSCHTHCGGTQGQLLATYATSSSSAPSTTVSVTSSSTAATTSAPSSLGFRDHENQGKHCKREKESEFYTSRSPQQAIIGIRHLTVLRIINHKNCMITQLHQSDKKFLSVRAYSSQIEMQS